MKNNKWIISTITVCAIAYIFLFTNKNNAEEQISFPTQSAGIISLPSFPYQKNLSKDVDNYMLAALSENRFPGAAVAIVKKDSVIYINTFGHKDVNSGAVIDKHSLFRLGSLSKGFHGILTQILVNKNCINWEDKVSEYIPEFKLSNDDYLQELTLSHLVSHSGGFPYHSYTNLVEAGSSLSNIAKEFIQIKNLSAPGSQYSYQNAAFAISEIALEKCTGQSYNELLRTNIFNAIGMSDASCTYDDMYANRNVAYPHYFSKGEWKKRSLNKKYYNAISAGGVNASISDMSKWMKLILGSDPNIIDARSLKKVFEPMVETKTRNKYYQKWPDFENSFYSHGWRVHTFFDASEGCIDTIYHHGGQVNGYRNEIFISPEDEIGICVMFSNYSLMARNIIPDLQAIIRKHGGL